MEQPQRRAHHHRDFRGRLCRPGAGADPAAARAPLQLRMTLDKPERSTAMASFLQLENVQMVFDTKKGRFVALRDISLNVEQGEFVSLIGHSGCGKSTLLNLVAGLLRPVSGAMILAGREISGP